MSAVADLAAAVRALDPEERAALAQAFDGYWQVPTAAAAATARYTPAVKQCADTLRTLATGDLVALADILAADPPPATPPLAGAGVPRRPRPSGGDDSMAALLARSTPLSANGLFVGAHPRTPGNDAVALHD